MGINLKRAVGLTAILVLSLAASAQEPVKVRKVAVLWTYAENERGTSEAGVRTGNDLLRRLFESRAGLEVASDAVVRAASQELNIAERPLTVEEPGQLPALPEPRDILALGRKAGVDYVCVGTLSWRVRSIWVGLGPKTKVDAVVDVIVVDVAKAEVVLESRGVTSDSARAEKWYETAGALLVAWGITLFSGGPKTPHIQRAAVKSIGLATDPFVTANSRKIREGAGETPPRSALAPSAMR